MSDYTPEVEAAVNELGGVNLPDNVTLLEVIGRGSRSIIFLSLIHISEPTRPY